MNKLTQNVFLVVYPFYPLWAWMTVSFLKFPADKILIFVMLPILIHNVWTRKIRLPFYLVVFILFTLFHLYSVFANGIMPDNTTPLLFFFSDINVFACVLFLVIESTNFDDGFIEKMNRHILWIVILSLVVSIIQIKDTSFFYNTSLDDGESFSIAGERNTSIYSFVDVNSGGITFPILISILLSVYETKSRPFPLIVLSGIAVSFLTKARYVMISTIIAFSQLLLVKTIPLQKKLYVLFFFVVGIFMIVLVAQMAGYNIDETINERILEKGGDMESAKARVHSYDVFMMKFPEHPYIGVGPKTRDDVIDLMDGQALVIHVGYLAYLYYYGALGAGLLFLALIFLIRDSWVIGQKFGFWGSFYGFLGFALANATFVYFVFGEMGIVLAVLYIRYYKTCSVR